MHAIHASAEASLAADAEFVYGILADYRHGHPAILPAKYFRNVVVDAGGTGAGTRLRFQMPTLLGWRDFSVEISEPEPGRVIEETQAAGIVTRFTVDPVAGGHCRVRIETNYQRAGIAGWIESRLAPPFQRKIFLEELLALVEHVAWRMAYRAPE
jgi:hypothetical protein